MLETEAENQNISESQSIETILAKKMIHINESKNGNLTIKTGFNDIDVLLGGFSLGEFIVIGGRPAMGKSRFLLQLTHHISTQIPALFLSLEMTENELISHFLAINTEINTHKIMVNDLEEFEKQQINSVTDKIKAYKLVTNCLQNRSIKHILEICQNQILNNDIKIIFTDNLQTICSQTNYKYKEQEMALICDELKKMALKYNVCIVASSQLSRAVEARGGMKIPQLSDLSLSGAIEQYADKVLFIHRNEYYGIIEDENGMDTNCKIDIYVAKNKHGNNGAIMLTRNENFTKIKEYKVPHFEFNQERIEEIDF